MRPPPAAEPVSILVVDDRRENLIALQAILQAADYHLVTASSGADALTRVLEQDFAVIILDVFMPEMDGFEVARLLKQRERSRDTSIIFLTAVGTEVQFAQRGYSVGAVDYLTKPIDAELLRAKVGVFVELFRRREQVKRQAELLREGERREQELLLAEQRIASERRYRFLTNALPQVVWTARPDGVVDYLNQRWEQLTGLPLEELGDSGWLVAVHPDDVLRCRQLFSEALRTAQPFSVECRLRRADGTYRWHLCRALPEFDAAGHIAAWLGTHTDIADQKRFQEEAQAAAKRSMLLVTASEHLVRSFDYGEALRQVERLLVPNCADWCSIVELGSPAPRGRGTLIYPDPNLKEWIPVPVQAPHPEYMRQNRAVAYLVAPLELRDNVIGEIRLAFIDSPRRYTASEKELIENLARHVAFAIENARLYDQAQRAVMMKDEVLAVVSHDLKNPLSAVELACEVLLRAHKKSNGANQPPPEPVLRIKRAAERMERLIGDILDMAGLQAGNLSVEPSRNAVEPILNEVVEALQPLASEKRNRLENDLHNEDLTAYFDRHRIIQVLINLVGNAIKFTPEGGAIKLAAEPRGDEVCIAVTDTGPGIGEEQLPHVFEPYWKGRQSRQGTGLGLYIAKGIVERHGGKIWVQTRQGEGSAFYFTLPKANGAERVEPR
jgi:PAS domain S-box-containing protein